jgi:exosortase
MSQTVDLGQLPKIENTWDYDPGLLWKTGLILLLLGWLYVRILGSLAAQWWRDPNFSHGVFVPAFSLYVVWQGRAALRRIRPSPSWFGIPVLLAGLGLLIIGNLGAELFLSRFSLLIVAAGVVICLLGWSYQRKLLFPWLFLILMIPIPAIFFNQITFPLQLIASKLASNLLPLLGVPVLREGNIIQIPAMPLEVAEACSGIRSLLSLATLSIIYGYLMESKMPIRIILALSAIPIAVASNSLRIVGTGLTVQYWSVDKGEGFFHLFSGWLIFVVSLGLLLILHKILQAFWRERVGA